MSHPSAPKQDDRHLRTARWPWIGAVTLMAGFIILVLLIIFLPTANIWTDDAYVQVHYAQIAPQISGSIRKITVTDNQSVQTGGLLVQLDDQPEQVALQQAQAQLDEAEAQFATASATLVKQPALIAQAQAQLATAKANLAFAAANKKRFDQLAGTGASSLQQRQQADADFAVQQARLTAASAALAEAKLQTQVLASNRQAAQAAVEAAQAAVAQAKLNLSYTQIKAPFTGEIDALSSQVGDYVSAGETLMTLVPLQHIYILANYRETALRHVLPGQNVKIHVDAYNIDLKGVVEGLAPATGSVYSPLAPSNATGNFTKIVQRLPVKILILPGQNLARLLRPGMSVETTIYTHLANVVGQQEHSTTAITTSIQTAH